MKRETAAGTLADLYLDQIRQRLVDICDPDRIILFGSHARGEAGPGSDIDLLVIGTRERDLPRHRRGLAARVSLADIPVEKDVLFYTPGEVERGRTVPASFINRVLREGRVVYER